VKQDMLGKVGTPSKKIFSGKIKAMQILKTP